MAQAYFQRALARKRQLGARLNYAHPLMRNCIFASLVNEGSGGLRNLVDGTICNHANWTDNYWGRGSEIGITTYFPSNTANTASFKHPLTSFAPFVTASNFSLWIYATPPRSTGKSGFFCRRDGGGNITYELVVNNDSPRHFEFTTQGNAVVGSTNVDNLYLDKFFALCLIHNASKSTRSMYFNTTLEASAATVSINAPTDQIQIIGNDDGSKRAQGSHGGVLIWNRAITADEVAWLATDPFDWAVEPLYRKYFLATTAIVPILISGSDSINNYADAVALANTQAANLGVVTGDQLALNDGISLTGPPPDYFLLLGDSIANLQDSPRLVLGMRQLFSDTVNNLVDVLTSQNNIPVQAFDSLQFNWADAVSLQLNAPLSITKSDSINNYADFVSVLAGSVLLSVNASDTINLLADAIRLRVLLGIVEGDNLVLSDSIKVRFSHLARIADALGITDAIQTDVSAKPAFSDSINLLADSVSIALAANHSVTAGDQLNLTDSVSVALSGVYNQSGFVDRIRRYLGDIQSS